MSPAEEKLRQETAADLVSLADWCAQNGARAAGTAFLEEGRELDRLQPQIVSVEKALAALAYESADGATLDKKKSEAGKELAKRYDRLAVLKHEDADEARFLEYALKAIRWDASEARLKSTFSMASSAASGGRLVNACRLLTTLRRLDPSPAGNAKYDALDEKLAAKDAVLLGTREHDLVAYVSLPRDWKRGRGYPVIVGVEGAGCNFAGYLKGLTGTRGSRGVIVVVPVSLSNTNKLEPSLYPTYTPALLEKWNVARIDFDSKGLDAILAQVRDRFGGEDKVFLTGFSGGGNLCYFRLFQFPSKVRGAVPCCANFAGYGADTSLGAGDSGGPPVHILTGEKDEHREFTFGDKNSPGIEPQTDRAMESLRVLGFKNVRRTMVKGAGHSPLQDQVWKFVDEFLGGK
jgi:dienelactone hydrolase